MSETIPEAFLAKQWALLTDSEPDAITPADLVLLCWRAAPRHAALQPEPAGAAAGGGTAGPGPCCDTTAEGISRWLEDVKPL